MLVSVSSFCFWFPFSCRKYAILAKHHQDIPSSVIKFLLFPTTLYCLSTLNPAIMNTKLGLTTPANKRKLALENTQRKRTNYSLFSPAIQTPVKPTSPPFKYPSPVKTPEELKTYSPVKTPPQSPLLTLSQSVIPLQSFVKIGASLARLDVSTNSMSQKRKSYVMLMAARKKIKF